MKVLRRAGSTSNILQIFIADSSSTTGAGLSGLTNASSGLAAYYHRDTDTTATAISLVTMTVGTFTSSGFKEVDATNMKGWYQFCPPDAALTTSAKSVGFHLAGAANMAPLPIEVDLDGQVDVYLWNGTVVATPATAGIPDVNVKNINNTAAATPGASGGILISGSNSGTTTLGALTVTGAFTINGTALDATRLDVAVSTRMATYTQPTGFLAATFPSGTIANTTNITAGTITTVTNLTNAPTSGDFTATMKASITTAATASSPTLDWSKVTNQSSTVVLSNTIISEAVNVNNILLGGITAASLASSATAAIATATWQDTTAGDFTVAGSIGLGLFTSGNAPGLTNGLLIAGSNAGTTMTSLTLGSFNVGGVSFGQALFTTQMTESYATLHTVPTLAQILFEIRAILAENNVTGTTVTTRKIDGSTTAETYTIDANPNPTNITRAS